MSSSVIACLTKFRHEYLEHVLRLGELVLAFAIGTSTLVAFGTQYWSETEDFHKGLWVNCGKDAQGKCDFLPITGEPGKGITLTSDERQRLVVTWPFATMKLYMFLCIICCHIILFVSCHPCTCWELSTVCMC